MATEKKIVEPKKKGLSLMDRIQSNSTIDESDVLSKSKFFTKKDMIPTGIYALDIALSADVDGGFTPGLTMWAGPSKHFKTAFTLVQMRAYQQKYKDGVVLFYDSEFGTPKSYFENFGIDMKRVVHSPLTDIEQLKFDIMAQLAEVNRGDKLFIAVDSIGNLASKKEVQDAIDQKSVADMTRAKQIKSLFRMVTPHLNIKDIPMVVVNHIYMTQEMFSTAVVSGGTGPYYSADNIFIVGRQQVKKDAELLGYDFIINVEKSRYVKEKSKIPVTVNFEDGINKYSGILVMAQESGHVAFTAPSWYQRVDKTTGELVGKKVLKKDTSTKEFMDPILNDETFKQWIKDTYAIGGKSIYSEDNVVVEDEG
jgi:RecA/RadA recombinase